MRVYDVIQFVRGSNHVVLNLMFKFNCIQVAFLPLIANIIAIFLFHCDQAEVKFRLSFGKKMNQQKKRIDKAKSGLVNSFLAGSVSAASSTIILQPLDLVKTRMQVTSSSSK